MIERPVLASDDMNKLAARLAEEEITYQLTFVGVPPSIGEPVITIWIALPYPIMQWELARALAAVASGEWGRGHVRELYELDLVRAVAKGPHL